MITTRLVAATLGCAVSVFWAACGSIQEGPGPSTPSGEVRTDGGSAHVGDLTPQTPGSHTPDRRTGDAPEARSAPCVPEGMVDIFALHGGTLSVPRDLGRVTACAHVKSVTANQLTTEEVFQKYGVRALNGYEVYRIQYVTEAPRGTARRATALVYAPSGGTPPYPIAAVAHGTSGMGPRCGATRRSWIADYMAQPLVGRGYAVVIPDYIGMGVDEGVYSYGVGEAEARAMIDGVRTLSTLAHEKFRPSELSDELFFVGHSQGGQAALFAHQYLDATSGKRLLGTVAYAPGFGVLRGLGQLMGRPDRPVDSLTLFLTFFFYSASSVYGGPPPGAWLSERAARVVPKLLVRQCWEDLVHSIRTEFPTEGDLFTRPFLDGLRACPINGDPCPTFEPWNRYLLASLPGQFKSDAPVLLAMGEKDAVVPPWSVACVRDRLTRQGSKVELCASGSADHGSLVGDTTYEVARWMAARRKGLPTKDICRRPVNTSCWIGDR